MLRRRARAADRRRQRRDAHPAVAASPVSGRSLQRALPVRRRALRGDGGAAERRVLPLHALPAAHRHRGLGPGTTRARLLPSARGRRARAGVRARRRLAEVLLLGRAAARSGASIRTRERWEASGSGCSTPATGSGRSGTRSSTTPASGSRFPTTASSATPKGSRASALRRRSTRRGRAARGATAARSRTPEPAGSRACARSCAALRSRSPRPRG